METIRQLIKILFGILLILMISCEKDEIKDCELNKTYTLEFSNTDLTVSVLSISNKKYDVSNIRYNKYIVPVNSEVYLIYKIKYRGVNTKIYYKDTVSYMAGRPNPCAVYNYYW